LQKKTYNNFIVTNKFVFLTNNYVTKVSNNLLVTWVYIMIISKTNLV